MAVLVYRDTRNGTALVYRDTQYAEGGDVSVSPTTAAGIAQGYAPAIAQGVVVSPGSAAVVAQGYAPNVGQGIQINPAPASVFALGYAPTVTGAAIVSPSPAAGFAQGYAPIIVQPQPARTIGIKQDDLMIAIRSFLLSLVTQPVLRTPVNRAAMPVGSFIAMSPGTVKALATNTVSGMRSVKRSSQFDCQIDCYGVDAGDTAAMLSMMFRDQYAIEQFELQPFEIVPLYADDAHQMPVVTGEEQYLERWTFDIAVQFNPVVSMPAQSATMLELSLRNVDRTYPP